MKCAKDLAPSLTNLINTSLTSGELPTLLKLATVSPVFKCGDKSLAAQYRPISLLPLHGQQTLEKVVDLQLRSYLEEFTVIPEEQFAYRSHHSTEDALVYATNNFLLAKDQDLYTGLVFVDMSKALDRVQHQTLINDLSEVRVRGSALKWFISYCKSRIFRTHFIFVYFVRGGFRTKIKCILKIQCKSENLAVSGCMKISCVRKIGGPKDTKI